MTADCISASECIYCHSILVPFPSQAFEVASKRLFVQLSLCTVCGWWTVFRVHQGEYPRTAGVIEGYSGTIGCLKELDLSDVSTPLHEVRKYFLVRQDSIREVHPKLLEDVVCSIFKDLGWVARVTAYSGDDGIDVILDDPSGGTIGIQVKRYRDKRLIEAEQIRSLAGALMLGGHIRGVFVTTSSFRRGAVRAAEKFSRIGYPIELIDAERFLNMLGIVQVQTSRLDEEQIVSYITALGVHLGSGFEKPFRDGEDLRNRDIVSQTWGANELIDLRDHPNI